MINLDYVVIIQILNFVVGGKIYTVITTKIKNKKNLNYKKIFHNKYQNYG